MNESPLVFPGQADRARIERYKHADLLYLGKHYEAFRQRAPLGFEKQYAELRYIVGNFAGLLSRLMADMTFGEELTIDLEDEQTQEFTSKLIEQNDLMGQLYESAIGNSRRGDACFKIRLGRRNPLNLAEKPTIIIEEFTPAIYFPALSGKAARNTPEKDVIAMVFARAGKTYLHQETHTPGMIFHEVFEYDQSAGKIVSTVKPEDFGFPATEPTRVDRSLVFHVPNFRDSTGFYGTSDYQDLESLFFALDNRMTKIDNILDKHSDPILAVPPGVIDENGKVRKEALGLFEVDTDSAGFNKPEYIVWNANLESAFTQVEKIIDQLFMFSEVAPATMGMDKNGQAESGRALKLKLISTIRKRNRKIRYYDQVIKEMMVVSQELALAWGITIDGEKMGAIERPKLVWPDGLINDEVEMVEVAVQRIDAGLSSRSDEIARLDGKSLDDAKAKVAEIDEERDPKLPVPANNSPTPPAPAEA